ncbi:hypothetical protein DW694_11590 [Ruminococcus sp. AM26-12LB]|nr:hypothetical protein DW694_11590 [Ruminococcus sp. AM26-12LB]
MHHFRPKMQFFSVKFFYIRQIFLFFAYQWSQKWSDFCYNSAKRRLRLCLEKGKISEKGKTEDERLAMKNVVTIMDVSSTDICMVVHTRL